MRSDVDMENRNILVLGASSGIGYAVTENFAQRGGTLFIAARRKEQLQGLQHKYGQVQGIWDCDLSVASNVKQIFIDLSKKGIKLDGMVFCAGTAKNTLEKKRILFVCLSVCLFVCFMGFH